MGVVTSHLINLITRQVEDRSLVVWYDPDGEYASVAESLKIPDTRVVRYDGSFFQLRREIDLLMSDVEPPRLVVYVPDAQANTHDALIELELPGVVMQPKQQPPACNTKLSLVARNALRPLLGEETAAEVEKQVEGGKLTLADVNALAEKGEEITKGVLTLVFGSGNPLDVALAFLNRCDRDADIEKKSAVAELLKLLQAGFGVTVPDGARLPEVRERLTRHILMTDLVAGLGDAVPPALQSVPIAGTPAAVNASVGLARTWRLRRDLRDTYVAAARQVEGEFGLEEQPLPPEGVLDVDTFSAVERSILHHVESALLDTPRAELLELAKSRLSRFWSDVDPEVQAEWALVASAAETLLEADRVEHALRKPPATVPGLVQAYAEGDSPWCLLDSHHRHMESRWCNFDPQGLKHETLGKLIHKARQRYTAVGSELAKHFVTQFQKAKHPLKGVLRQVQVFDSQVRPRMAEGKTAYVWVDALRFEMARELCDVLKGDFDLSIQAAVGTMPTITEIGMAALLPKAGESAKVVAVGGGKLGMEIDGTILRDRKDRVAFLKEHAGVAVFDAKLDDLLPQPSKKVRTGIESAELVLVTSQEIDELCEQGNTTQARRQMDGVLNDLRRGVRVLSEHGVKSIVMVADHGHLFGEEIGEDMKIESPGGETADLHRRVWVGVGGTVEPSYMRSPLASLGVASDLDIATPWTFACFKSKGGGKAYFHGGLSPQELIIPVVTLTPNLPAMSGPPKGIDWKLTPGSPKLTTRFFSVQIAGIGVGLFDLQPPKVRVELQAKGNCISMPVSASYGYEEATGEVALRLMDDDPKKIATNTVTVMVVAEEIAQKTVRLALLDASTGKELRGLDKIEVAISL